MSTTNLAYKALQSTSHKGHFNNQDSQEIEITKNGFVTFRDDIADYIAKNGLTRTQTQLLFFLASLDKYGDRPVKLKVAEILLATGIKKSAYHAAISFFEEKGWFKFIHNEVIVQNLSCKHSRNSDKHSKNLNKHSINLDKHSINLDKHSINLDKHSINLDNQNPKVAQEKDSVSLQTYSDIYRSDQIDDDDFLNFDEEVNTSKNLDCENVELSEQNQIDKFEDSQELIQKDELIHENEVIEPDKAIDEAKISKKAKGTVEVDLFRRGVDAYILENSKNVRNPTAYLKSISTEDRSNWEQRYRDAIAPSSQNASTKTSYQQSHKPRDPVAEDPHKLAMAIDSAMRCRDIDFAIARLEMLREIDADKADELELKHGLKNY